MISDNIQRATVIAASMMQQNPGDEAVKFIVAAVREKTQREKMTEFAQIRAGELLMED